MSRFWSPTTNCAGRFFGLIKGHKDGTEPLCIYGAEAHSPSRIGAT